MTLGFGHCRCRSCPLFADNFDRADSTTVGNEWTEFAGDWSISSNALTTTDTNARIWHPGITAWSRVAFDMTIPTNGKAGGQGLSATYGFLYQPLGTGQTLIWVNVDGTWRKRGYLTEQVTHHVEIRLPCGGLCMSNGSTCIANGLQTSAGGGGLITGDTLPSAVVFDNFATYCMYEDCAGSGDLCYPGFAPQPITCPCVDCYFPDEVSIVIAGSTTPGLNGTYVVSYSGEVNCPGCFHRWGLTGIPVCNGAIALDMFVNPTTGVVSRSVNFPFTGICPVWGDTNTEGMDCHFDGVVLPYISGGGGGTATLTAL